MPASPLTTFQFGSPLPGGMPLPRRYPPARNAGAAQQQGATPAAAQHAQAAQEAREAQIAREALEVALRRAGPLLGKAAVKLPLLDPLVAKLTAAQDACNLALPGCAPAPLPPRPAAGIPRAVPAGCPACNGRHVAHECGKARPAAGGKAARSKHIRKPQPVDELVFDSLPDDMGKRTFTKTHEVDGEEKTEHILGIGWQPSAADLAPHALPGGGRKAARIELTKETYPLLCAFAEREGVTVSGRSHVQARGDDGVGTEQPWNHNHLLQQVMHVSLSHRAPSPHARLT